MPHLQFWFFFYWNIFCSLIWLLCISFASQHFSNLLSVKKIRKRLSWIFFIAIIVTKNPLYKKVGYLTFLSSTPDVLLYKWKNSEFEIDVTLSIYNNFQFFLLLPLLIYPLRIFFCLWWFCPILARKKKKIENAFLIIF